MSNSLQVKRNVVLSIVNLVYELAQESPKDLTLRILGKNKILGISQIWMETLDGAQPPCHKSNFGNTCKSRYQTFLVLSSFAVFLYFYPGLWVPNFVLN